LSLGDSKIRSGARAKLDDRQQPQVRHQSRAGGGTARGLCASPQHMGAGARRSDAGGGEWAVAARHQLWRVAGVVLESRYSPFAICQRTVKHDLARSEWRIAAFLTTVFPKLTSNVFGPISNSHVSSQHSTAHVC